jgi:MoaA/NifB/PqqE/SkfB family radical SAM enzyme
MIKLVSIELTNFCSKGPICASFGCYAGSSREGATFWTPETLGRFIRDLSENGVEAVSLGGGEPLEYSGIWELLHVTQEIQIFKSMTTNGLLLTEAIAGELAKNIDKVHVSLHFPENPREVDRVIGQVKMLETKGLRSGINFLVKGVDLEAEKAAVRLIKAVGIQQDRVIFLPLRGKGVNGSQAADAVKEVGRVLSGRFQSTWCLLDCGRSPRFVSVDWEGRVGYCSYTPAKTRMADFTHHGMMEALHAKDLVYCG